MRLTDKVWDKLLEMSDEDVLPIAEMWDNEKWIICLVKRRKDSLPVLKKEQTTLINKDMKWEDERKRLHCWNLSKLT